MKESKVAYILVVVVDTAENVENSKKAGKFGKRDCEEAFENRSGFSTGLTTAGEKRNF